MVSALSAQAVSSVCVASSHRLHGRGHCSTGAEEESDGLDPFAKKAGNDGLRLQFVHRRSAVAVTFAAKYVPSGQEVE